MLDLVHVRSFAAVAERGTVAAAGRALGYTPPAISQHIAKLESELGTALFDRVGGRLVLTPAGQRLRPIAHEMADLADSARAATAASEITAHFVIAGFASAIETIVLPQLHSLRESMTLDIVEAEDAEAMRELALGTVDVVLTQEYAGVDPRRDSRFEFVPLVRDELRLILPPWYRPTTRVADVAHESWLINGSGTRCAAATERLLAREGIAPSISGTVSDNATLLALVAAGHGVTIAPALIVDRQRHDVVIAEQRFQATRTIFGVTRGAVASRMRPLLDALGDGDASSSVTMRM